MRTLLILIASLALAAFAFGRAVASDVVNSTCPISGQPVKEGVVVKTDAGSIGVCCSKCQTAVEGWGAEKKAKFVANAKQDGEKAEKAAKADGEKKEWKGDPYLLETCAASGRPIDVKGTPTTKVVDGRELKFCCGGCADVVAKDPAKWLEKVDEAQIAAQMPLYPMEKCIISGEPLFEKDDEGKMQDIGTNVVINNRLFRVCCKMCAKKLKSDPSQYGVKLNETAMAAQEKSYPLETCVVNTKGKLGDKAQAIMVGGRLVKTCCGSCAAKVEKDPVKYVAMVEKARAEAAAKDEAGKELGLGERVKAGKLKRSGGGN